MTKWFRLACAGAALSAALTASALAADFTACAELLSDLGLVRGTEQGYELDRAPTRAEAAAMLVRLLGAEEEAQALDYTAPFTDLESWEQPYVQYLYAGGLTTGASATTFEPEQPCTAQMYAAFLLRALGYTEADGDFTYDNAVAAAQQAGVYDPAAVDTADFLRDDVAAASFTALSCTPDGAEGTLLDRLTGEGAVNAEAAAPYQALFADYASYRADTAGMDTLTGFSISSSFAEPVVLQRGGTELLTLQTQETMAFDKAAGTMQADRVLTLSAPDVAQTSAAAQTRLRDGTLYRRLDGGAWAEQLVSEAEQARLLAAYAPVPLAYVDAIRRETDGLWRISCETLPPLYRELLWPVASAAGGSGEAAYSDAEIVHQTADGRIVSQELTAAFEQDGISGNPVLRSTLDRADAPA